MQSVQFNRQLKSVKHLPNALVLCFSAIVVATVFAGCSKGNKLSSADQSAFASATPELKQSWADAQAAAAANDHVKAILTLRAMINPALSPEQITAVHNAIEASDAVLMKAASHGDLEAQKKLETLRAASTASATR